MEKSFKKLYSHEKKFIKMIIISITGSAMQGKFDRFYREDRIATQFIRFKYTRLGRNI